MMEAEEGITTLIDLQAVRTPGNAQLHEELLSDLVTAITDSNAFYREKIRDRGLRRDRLDLATFTACWPFTTKAELIDDQRRHPPYGTNLTYPVENYTQYWQTSGTAATPMRWLDTQDSLNWMSDAWSYMFHAMGIHAGDKVLAAFGFGPFLGFWTAYEAAQRMGCLCFPAGGMSSETRLRMLADNEISVLFCTPTYAARLGHLATISGTPAALSVRAIVVAGEPGGCVPAVRQRLAELWPNATVFDQYGMTEVGPVAYQRPDEPDILHIVGHAYLSEVINPDTLLPVRPGEVGELVLTNLGRLGSPVLRYRTGDLVRGAAPAGPGPHDLDPALRGGIIGRADDMMIVRGVNVHPSAVESVLHQFREIVEFRVTHTTPGDLAELCVEVELNGEEADPAARAAQISKALTSALGLRIPVTPVEPGLLPRFELKARRWRKETS